MGIDLVVILLQTTVVTSFESVNGIKAGGPTAGQGFR